MKLVIDISEKIYDAIMSDEMPTIEQMSAIVLRIYQGIPLPKGHGRLIDAGALDKEVISHVHSGYAESPKDCAKFSMMIITAPTIIEADKAESEETEIIKCHGKQITVPKGTFEKILNDNEDEESEV